MRTLHFILLCLAFLLAGCFWGSGNQCTIKGDFSLEQWEDGKTYYLHKRGQDDSSLGGSIIEGIVVRLGWNTRYILAQRYSFYRGDPDGWMIIDVQTDKIIGPFTDAELQARPEQQGIVTYPAADAWRRL